MKNIDVAFFFSFLLEDWLFLLCVFMLLAIPAVCSSCLLFEAFVLVHSKVGSVCFSGTFAGSQFPFWSLIYLHLY